MTEFALHIVDERRALEHLMALLRIEGLSGQEGNVAAEVRKRLGRAGCKSSWIRHDNAHRRIGRGYQVGNLIVRIPGNGVRRREQRRLFSGHMDTVPLCRGAVPELSGDRIVSKGATALGGDNRTAVAALVTVVESLLRNNLPHPPLTFLFTVGEEVGLEGSKVVNLKDMGHPAIGFNVDGGHPDFAVIGAIGADRWQAHVHGRSSHAGVHPEHGISATLIASRAISAVAEQGFFGQVMINGQYGTANVGAFQGGEASNQVTDYVLVTGECRSHSRSFLRTITATYRKAFTHAASTVRNNRGEPGRVEFLAERDYNAFRMSARSEPVQRAKDSIEALGGEPKLAIANGGLDANYLNSLGVPTVTLGAGQHNPHTIDEYIDIDEYSAGCRLLTLLAAS
ncbi:MAG: M20/M25/M40 family metallo-hydrolase [Pseudomonadales bacterium]|jgi:tripeptide aminopeptidase|nr:M20/M25/M40 family metallo-hydrolase [Pseudomonadales bacterium]MDP7596900.1 M20/M25/M40 family metallo-hydrolase [Pseudomonadales bacterium]HJN51725.1 M20/M25/M40 family metallo-hydrolase [Pseudomonadales bacterium]|tara:strand:- start:1464 stop:2654 length:1191 start_codon:yes stop_codon:yes gene_type:complete